MPTARPAFGRFARFAFRASNAAETAGPRFFNFAIGLRRRQVSDFQRQTARSSEPLTLP